MKLLKIKHLEGSGGGRGAKTQTTVDYLKSSNKRLFYSSLRISHF